MPFQSLAWMRRHGPFLRRCHARYGDIFTLRLAYEGNVVILAHPDAVREVFTGDPSVVHAGEASAVLRPIVGRESLLVLDDRPHLLKRKLLLPRFHGEHMPGYEALMREVAEREVERWPNDQAFSLLPRMHTIAVEVILQALLGVAQGSYLERLRDSVRELLDRYTETRTMAALFILGPALTLRVTALGELLRRVDEALYAEIACRRHDRHCEGREDVISLLLQARLEDGAQMSDEDVRDQLMSLIVAGHETTGTALAWALERLLRTPSALHRLREEIAAGQDAYADAVCKETLRLRPVVPVVTRRLQESTQIGGWLLRAGTTVAPCIDLIHRRPDIYPEPSQFRPERFLDDSAGAGTYTWIPFGGGVRRCLGAGFALLEMRTVLTTILAQARFRATRIRGERVRRRAVSWAPDRGAEVILEPKCGCT